MCLLTWFVSFQETKSEIRTVKNCLELYLRGQRVPSRSGLGSLDPGRLVIN